MRAVLSDAAESACGRIRSTLGVARLGASLTRGGARLEGTRAVLLADPRHGLVLPHMTSIAEEFSRELLLSCSAPHLDLGHPMRRDLWVRMENQNEGGWEEHIDCWKRWHSIRVKLCPQYRNLMTFVQARNAIMHGVGHLTRRQLRADGGESLRRDLKVVGISAVGTRLLIGDRALDACVEVACGYIAWLDMLVSEMNLERAA